MKIDRLSKKQFSVFSFILSQNSTLICDGAVRSGKTTAMLDAFVIWAMAHFSNTAFALCGKTVQSAERNLLKPLMLSTELPYSFHYRKSEKTLLVRCGDIENTFYIFGGKDESSYMLIQGLTLAGVMFDEVALMPKSFVEQAIARTLSVDGPKLWFNCNPESPNHWFYKEWIEPKPQGVKHLHFSMKDNPAMTADKIAQAELKFKGVFHDRYIKGLWVRAEGVIFKDFADDPEPWIIDEKELPEHFASTETGFDIGGNKSAYALTTSSIGYDNVIYVRKSKKTKAAELNMADIEKLVASFCQGSGTEYINCDHVHAIINSLKDNTPYRCGMAYKPPLIDRPFVMSKLLATRRIRFVRGACDDLIDELRNMVYDSKKDEAIPLDDGTMQIDAWDSFIYSISGKWKHLAREETT